MIRRRWPETAVFVLASMGLFAWARVLRHDSFFWAAVAAVFGLALAAAAVIGPADGPCPLCGKTISDLWILAAPEFQRCPHCRRYHRHSDRREVADDYMSRTPSFHVPVGTGAALPPLCCVCAAASERVVDVVHRREGRVSNASPLVIKTELKISIPYCGKHEDGVTIREEDRGWALAVRSYGFYRAAVMGR